MGNTAEKIETRILPVQLNAEELAAYSYDLAKKEREASSLEGEKKAIAKDFQGRIDVLRAEISDLAAKVETRSEDREVECDLIYYDQEGEVETVRRDTGEVVTRRPMTQAEKQKALPIEFRPKAVKAGAEKSES